MRLKLILLLCLGTSLLVAQTQPVVLGVPSEGTTYYYSVNIRWTTQENLGEIYNLYQSITCRFTILQAIIVRIRYLVAFSGYSVRYPYNYVSTNSSVDLSSNLLSFDLDARDYDADDRSSYASMDNTPHYSPIEDCDVFIVNPNWAAHEDP